MLPFIVVFCICTFFVIRHLPSFLTASTRSHLLHLRQLFSDEEHTILLLFPDKNLPCKTYYRGLINARPIRCNLRARDMCHYIHHDQSKTSLMKLLEALRAAIKVDICIYRFTLDKMADFLIDLSKLGTKVRIIADEENYDNTQIPKLQQANIEVRRKKTNSTSDDRRPLMHNKFVIIDKKTCFLGSFNWTVQAVTKNHEAIIKTSEPTIVEPLLIRFEEMWLSLAPLQQRVNENGLRRPPLQQHVNENGITFISY